MTTANHDQPTGHTKDHTKGAQHNGHNNGTNVTNGVSKSSSTPYVRPDAPDHGRYVTKEEYWAIYYEHPAASYEWNNGYLEAKPMPTPPQYKLFLWFLALLKEYSEVHEIGQLMGLETGFAMTIPDLRLPGQQKETVRKPDVAFIRYDNPVEWGDDDRSYKGICDLCIEVISDSHQSEIDRDTIVKKEEYELAGVQEYFILDEGNRYTKFYRRNRTGLYVEIEANDAGILSSTVLPGFQWRAEDLLRRPSLEILAEDSAYQGYVLLRYQTARARADAALQRADWQQQRADVAEERASNAEVRASSAEVRASSAEERASSAEERASSAEERADVAQQQWEAERTRAETLNAELQDAMAELARLRAQRD